MAHGFASPIDALNQIVTCLGEWPVEGTIIHTGSAGSGLGIDCCPALLRVESESVRPTTELTSFQNLGKGCKPVAMEVVVSYLECWVAQNDTPQGRPAEDYKVMGNNVIISWWQALERLACCSPWNTIIRFVEERDLNPDGCVGWSIRLEVDVSFCGCPVTTPEE